MNKILLIIPAYNEEENIVRVVENLVNKYSEFDYVVINDGSKDSTAKLCRENGYNLVDLPLNCGLSGAFQTGMKYAMRKGYDYAIQYDGDGRLWSEPGNYCNGGYQPGRYSGSGHPASGTV